MQVECSRSRAAQLGEGHKQGPRGQGKPPMLRPQASPAESQGG
jgi:hypothetical protein